MAEEPAGPDQSLPGVDSFEHVSFLATILLFIQFGLMWTEVHVILDK